jgi:hypothetical protein
MGGHAARLGDALKVAISLRSRHRSFVAQHRRAAGADALQGLCPVFFLNLQPLDSRQAHIVRRPYGQSKARLRPRVAPQLGLIQRHAQARTRGEMNMEIFETQRFGDQVAGQDLRTEMLAPPGQLPQSGKNL